MAPRTGNGKGKGNKGGKGDRKKKEEKVVPSVIDITVVTPFQTELTLKGISTDKLIDIKKLLGSHVETCHLTNYSLSHAVRGQRLEAIEIASLKPCVLKIVEEEYENEEQAIEHVRRLLDLFACTTAFGKQKKQSSSTSTNEKSPRAPSSPPPAGCDGSTVPDPVSVPSISAQFDMEAIKPAPKLGEFYDFFSLSHVTPPVQFIRRHEGGFSSERKEGDYFELEVKVCNGKLLHVVASVKGFYAIGKEHIVCNSLVDLLQQLSSAFSNAYDTLMKAFLEHNKFGNLPYGFRANSWLAPPILLESSSLPQEDENWGGNGGGQGRNGKFEKMKWATEFSIIQGLPCKSEEERVVRDRKAFLLHELFLDTVIFKSTSLIKNIVDLSRKNGGSNGGIVHEEKIGDLHVIIRKDENDASLKRQDKVDLVNADNLSHFEVSKRNILKGLTADESVIVKDTGTLGVVIVKQCGYTATVNVSGPVRVSSSEGKTNIDKIDQPNGGSGSLNLNSLRVVLPRLSNGDLNPSSSNPNSSKPNSPKPNSPTSMKALVRKIFRENLENLSKSSPFSQENRLIRWELGYAWMEHLKKKKEETLEKESKESKENEDKKAVKGLGMQLKKIKKKNDDVSGSGTDFDVNETNEGNDEMRKLIGDELFDRLKNSGTGFHNKSLDEIVQMARKYRDDVALPKLVADFGSLELSPVDGKTMSDFLHMRGLNVSSLGRLVELAKQLPHIQSICIHEMVIRSFKHIIRAVIASIDDFSDMPLAISEILNILFGNYDLANEDNKLRTKWVETFLFKRFNWRISNEFFHLRKTVLLRGLCIKVGIELIAKDYDFNSSNPFDKCDIISLFPICKHVACSTADGRNLLESSKTALDKGKLDDALSHGTKALAKMIAVCGPHHKMSANAYSLLAVVLYHTGDFDQATIYQQKALDIHERELGFDHPETMKSYGDLSVFYYRLQHIELALKYVNRALYLLQISCGLAHPNSAATYINVAMMEEGMGNVHIALRYLHEALKCNTRLLGADHIQTAASYHAIAIALSMMDAFSLSAQHEQTTLQILESKLGSDDLCTQDAVAWLEYFESRVLEEQEAAKRGLPKPDPSISSKGHLSVSDLLDYINPDNEKKERETHKKHRRVKNNNKSNQEEEAEQESSKITLQPEQILKLQSSPPNSPKLPKQQKAKASQIIPESTHQPEGKNVILTEEYSYSDEGWQEAGTKNRSNQINQKNMRKKPVLPKLNVHPSSEDTTYSKKKTIPVPVKGNSEGRNILKDGNESNKLVRIGTMASKSVSYKDVAVSPPGTILKPNMEKAQIEKEIVKETNVVEIREEVEKKLLEEEDTREAAKSPDTEDPEKESPVVEKDDSSTESQSDNKKNNASINGSKLSASAPPFKPGFKTVPVLNNNCIEIGTGTGFGINQGFYAFNNNSNNSGASVMNPNAAEFVPSKALQKENKINENEKVVTGSTGTGTKEIEDKGEAEKSIEKVKKNNRGKEVKINYEKTELARQILLNFIVKSVRDSLDSSDEIGTYIDNNNTGEIIKVGDVPILVPSIEKKKDLEGFTVVSKKRTNNNNNNKERMMSNVNGLYANHSICSSAS